MRLNINSTFSLWYNLSKLGPPIRSMSPLMSPPLMFVPLLLSCPLIWGGDKSPMCKRPRENPTGSCQCSVDPVLSSHDEPYFETYLSSQAFFTFVTEVCTISFERPVNYLCDAWHVFPPKYEAWTHFNRPWTNTNTRESFEHCWSYSLNLSIYQHVCHFASWHVHCEFFLSRPFPGLLSVIWNN